MPLFGLEIRHEVSYANFHMIAARNVYCRWTEPSGAPDVKGSNTHSKQFAGTRPAGRGNPLDIRVALPEDAERVFAKRETIKAQIRKLKEKIADYEAKWNAEAWQ